MRKNYLRKGWTLMFMLAMLLPFSGKAQYCAATNAGSACLTNVTFNTLNRSSAGCENAPSYYTDVSPGTATTTVLQGVTYPLSVTLDASGAGIMSVWIDYNQDFVLAASEWQQIATNAAAGSTTTINVTIPAGATPGTTRMRIRSRLAFNPNGAGDACTAMGSGETEDYTITIASPVACSGTPSPGATTTSASPVCPGVAFTLGMTTPPAASGITYQWQSSPDGVTYTNIGGATSGSYSTTQTADTYYQVIVTCTSSGLSATSTPIMVAMNSFMNCYCSSSATLTGDEDIFNVSIGTLNNSSTCSTTGGAGSTLNMYSNYTGVAAPVLTTATSYPLSVQIGTCGGNYNNATRVFIDFNHNGLFTDAGETVYTSPSSIVGPHTESGLVAIPATALTGLTRMRVVTVETTAPTGITPCGTYTWGETEDYLVDIVAATPCTGTPTSGTTISSANPVCPSVNFTLSMSTPPTGATGITYQWQSSTDGVTYTNIGGATNIVLTTSQTVATYYQVVVTCTNSGLTSTSTPVLVNMSPFMSCYCNSIPSFTGDEEITNVTLNTLNNSSTCSTVAPGPGSIAARYGNYMSGSGAPAAPQVFQATLTNFSVTVGSCGSFNYTSGLAIFMDLNHNGSFADAGEKVYSNGPSANINCVPPTVVNGSFTIPVTALTGITAMRIINAEGWSGDAITPCMTYGYGETEDYLVDIVPATPCTGTPSAGVTTSTLPSVCSTTSFTLNMSTPPSGMLGITYQWQSSPTGATYTNIGGATNATLTTTQSAATWYQVIVTCTNSGMADTSAPIQVNMNPFTGCYCSSMATTTADEEILNVTVNTLNNSSTCSTLAPGPGSVMNRYSNYMSGSGAPTAPNVIQNVATNFSVTVGSCGTWNYTSGLAIFVDLNQNGSFADAGEKVYSNGPTADINCVPPTTVTGTFTIPATAMLGVTGMRIINAEFNAGDDITSCFSFGYGETEDYLININPPPPIDMQALTVFSPTSVSCHSATDSVVVTIKNNGSAMMDFSVTPVTVSAASTATNPAVFTPVVISTGTLASGATQNVTVANPYSTAVAGTYTFTASTSVTGDGFTANDAMVPVSINVQGVDVTADNDTICSGDSVHLDVTLPPSMAPIGTGTLTNTSTTYPAPYGNWYGGAKHQMLVLASELSAAGVTPGPITGLTFEVTNTNAADPLMNFTIDMAATSVTSLSSFVTTGFSTVYTNASYAPTVGTNLHTFSTPFVWDGVSNVIVQTCFVNEDGFGGTTYTNNATMLQTTTPFTSSAYDFADGDLTICSSSAPGTMNQRPNMKFMTSVPYTYAWSPAAGLNNPNIQNPAGQITTPTTYTVVVTDGNGCTMTDSITVYVHSLPMLTLNDTTVCAGSTYVLNAQNPGHTYLWNTGAVTQTISVSTGGLYYVDITNNNGCTIRDSVMLNMNPLPFVDLGPDASFCAGDSITLDAGNAGFNYLWNTGATTQTINVLTSGAYYVAVTNPATGCTAIDTNDVTVNPLPVVNFGPDTAICAGDSIVLDATTTNGSYMWNDMSTNPTLTVTAAGTYTVMAMNTVTGCMITESITVSINALPVVNLGADTAICNGSTLTLDAMNPGASYLWSDASTMQTLNVTTAGTYSVDVTDANGCTGSDAITVSINPDPVVNIGPDSTQCGGSITFDAGNPGDTYLWSDGSTAQTLTVTTSGTYYATVTNSFGCSTTDTAIATINFQPVVNFGPDVVQCGGSVMLDAGNPGMSYMWTDNSTNQMLNVFISGTFDVTVTDTLTGCNDSDTINITINPVPVVDLGNDTIQCGGTVMLDAGAGASSYLWSDGSMGQTLSVAFSGSYAVAVSNGTCITSDTISVTIHVLPAVGMTPFPTSICLQQTAFTLTNGLPAGGVYSGTGVSAGMFDPATAGVGVHPITYTVTDVNGCSNSTAQNANVVDCIGIEENALLQNVNVFPNPTSGMFSISISNANFSELNIVITDMQGKVVFNETDKTVTADYNKQISIENLAKGIYYIKLSSGNEMNIKKLIVQ